MEKCDGLQWFRFARNANKLLHVLIRHRAPRELQKLAWELKEAAIIKATHAAPRLFSVAFDLKTPGMVLVTATTGEAMHFPRRKCQLLGGQLGALAL
jgi:hypothetical protein